MEIYKKSLKGKYGLKIVLSFDQNAQKIFENKTLIMYTMFFIRLHCHQITSSGCYYPDEN